jgi:hypothetical protein
MERKSPRQKNRNTGGVTKSCGAVLGMLLRKKQGTSLGSLSWDQFPKMAVLSMVPFHTYHKLLGVVNLSIRFLTSIVTKLAVPPFHFVRKKWGEVKCVTRNNILATGLNYSLVNSLNN